MKKTTKVILAGLATAGLTIGIACSKSSSNTATDSTSSYAGPGSHYTFSFTGSNFTITKYASPASTTSDYVVTGTSTSYSTGFKLLTISTVSGSGGPTVGSTAYAMEVPGVAMFIKPLVSTDTQVLVAVASGTCPSATFTANWIIVKKTGSTDMSGSTTDAYGTFNYAASTSTTGVGSLPSKYTLANNGTNLLSSPQAFASATCSNGLMSVSNGGGDTATMYLTTAGAALVNTASSASGDGSFIFGLPQASITTAALAGDYAGIMYSENASTTDKIKPISITLNSSGAGTGTALSDVTTGTTSSGSATINLSGTANSPQTGMITGTVTVSSTTTNIACIAHTSLSSAAKKVISCSGRDPGNSTKLFNFLLVSK